MTLSYKAFRVQPSMTPKDTIIYSLAFYGVYSLTLIDWKRLLFSSLKSIPIINNKVKLQVEKTVSSIHSNLTKHATRLYPTLPLKPVPINDIKSTLISLNNSTDFNFIQGKLSGAVYHGGQDLTDLTSFAYSLYSLSNPLHPETWPSIRQMEAEIVSMVLDLYHGDDDSCGSVTSGGTESILMAVKSARDYYRQKGVTRPEMFFLLI